MAHFLRFLAELDLGKYLNCLAKGSLLHYSIQQYRFQLLKALTRTTAPAIVELMLSFLPSLATQLA
jgi:hypothetical protein